MNAEQFRRLEALYDAAAAMDPAEQARFIDENCSTDEELRRELIAALAGTGSGLTGAVEHAAAAAIQDDDNSTGRHVGPYRIVRPLGRGGMGAVYLAVRDDDQFHKEVAIDQRRSRAPRRAPEQRPCLALVARHQLHHARGTARSRGRPAESGGAVLATDARGRGWCQAVKRG